VTGLLVGYIAEPLIGDGVATLLGGVRMAVGAAGAAGALTFCTLMQMLFGEPSRRTSRSRARKRSRGSSRSRT